MHTRDINLLPGVIVQPIPLISFTYVYQNKHTSFGIIKNACLNTLLLPKIYGDHSNLTEITTMYLVVIVEIKSCLKHPSFVL